MFSWEWREGVLSMTAGENRSVQGSIDGPGQSGDEMAMGVAASNGS